MQEILYYFKQNSSFVLSILTAVYVLLTFFILIQMRKEHIASRRAYLNVRTYLRDRAVDCLLIKNIGNTPAYNVKFDLDKDFYQHGKTDRNIREFPVFTNVIESIAPRTEYHIDLAQYQLFFEEERDDNLVPTSFTITANYSYRSIFFRKKVKERTTIDMMPTYMTKIVPSDIPSELKILNDKLDELIKVLKKWIIDIEAGQTPLVFFPPFQIPLKILLGWPQPYNKRQKL